MKTKRISPIEKRKRFHELARLTGLHDDTRYLAFERELGEGEVSSTEEKEIEEQMMSRLWLMEQQGLVVPPPCPADVSIGSIKIGDAPSLKPGETIPVYHPNTPCNTIIIGKQGTGKTVTLCELTKGIIQNGNR